MHMGVHVSRILLESDIRYHEKKLKLIKGLEVVICSCIHAVIYVIISFGQVRKCCHAAKLFVLNEKYPYIHMDTHALYIYIYIYIHICPHMVEIWAWMPSKSTETSIYSILHMRSFKHYKTIEGRTQQLATISTRNKWDKNVTHGRVVILYVHIAHIHCNISSSIEKYQ